MAASTQRQQHLHNNSGDINCIPCKNALARNIARITREGPFSCIPARSCKVLIFQESCRNLCCKSIFTGYDLEGASFVLPDSFDRVYLISLVVISSHLIETLHYPFLSNENEYAYSWELLF